MVRPNANTSGSDNSQGNKKVLERIQDPELKGRVAELLRNHSREAYIKRLQRCGVIVKGGGSGVE